jgi:hypothetical protein
MDRFLEVLRLLELNPAKTNDTKAVDIFQILWNFIKALGYSTPICACIGEIL